mmetsp:Transcript_17247/g.42379  ORF Transcript_17247/g.42379 Transcript_17247/m.42379 type:complete len:100 (+) Transcript_17247:153-452(+)
MADAKPPCPQGDLDNLAEQLESVSGDKDRVRLVKTAAGNFTFTCEQVARLVKIQRSGDAQTQTAIVLYKAVSDKEHFDTVLAEYKWDEDKEQIRKECGL